MVNFSIGCSIISSLINGNPAAVNFLICPCASSLSTIKTGSPSFVKAFRQLFSVDLDSDRTVVGAQHVAAEEGAFETRAQGLGDQEVIDAPADIPGAGAGHDAPPGVMSTGFLEFAE